MEPWNQSTSFGGATKPNWLLLQGHEIFWEIFKFPSAPLPGGIYDSSLSKNRLKYKLKQEKETGLKVANSYNKKVKDGRAKPP